MADLTIIPAEVALVSGQTTEATAAETVAAGELVYNDPAAGVRPAIGTSAVAADVVGLAISGASTGQRVLYALPGATVDLGATAAVAAGATFNLSAAGAGGIAPSADAGIGVFVTTVGVGGIGANQLAFRVNPSGVAKV